MAREYRPTATEAQRYEGAPLAVERLAQIWRALPEDERLPFTLALEERLADRVMELTALQARTADNGR